MYKTRIGEVDEYQPVIAPQAVGTELLHEMESPDEARRLEHVWSLAVDARGSLHLTKHRARDRQRLERLFRYVARPAIAASRLSALDDGRLLYQLKKRWRDGTTHVVFEPLEFIAKLAALIPAPRVHLVRYHGVLAPGAPGRERIVPQPNDAEETAKPCAQKHSAANTPTSKTASSTQTNVARTNSVNHRYDSWAVLMRRVFAIDVLAFPRCQSPMKILAQIHPPETTRKILQCLGLPARPPPIAAARPDPQESLPFDSDEAAPLD